jgi:uncharacterized protein (DUF2235 family)
MTKRLVVCCDGTWNIPDQQCPTNVTKLALGIAVEDDRHREQRVFYHRGIGSTRGERLRGGAFGFGLSRDVRDCYRFLVENYEPGDELFLVGFSRGAFTARSTAGLVRNSGILRRTNAGRIGAAYELYRRREMHPRGTEATLFRRTWSHEPRIRFIGVWDTVGALGIPLSGMPLIDLVNRRWQFHDTTLSTTVDAAFQALAIDERRRPFVPTLWSQAEDAPAHQRVEQVWFPGVHSDVGGGYPDGSLADVALLWLVDRARECGLVFRPDAFAAQPPAGNAAFAVRPQALGELHDSLTPFYRALGPVVRPIGQATRGHEGISDAADQRWDADLAYRPAGLVAYRDRTREPVS